MNTVKAYAEKLAAEYAPKQTNKVVALRKLDRKAKMGANVFAYSLFVLTILSKDAPVSSANWLIYIYALYGTVKMALAIRGIVRKQKSPRQYALSFLGLSSALYTMQMMEISLIAAFGDSQDSAMYMMKLFTQGAIFLISLFMVGVLVYKTLAKKRDQDTVV